MVHRRFLSRVLLISFATLISLHCATVRSPDSPHAHLTETEQQNEALALMGTAERFKTAGNLNEAIFYYERVAREFPKLEDEATETLFSSVANDQIGILKCLKRRGSDSFHASKLGLMVQIRDSLKNKAVENLLTLVSCDFSQTHDIIELDDLEKIDPIIAMPQIVTRTESFIWEKEKLIDHDRLYYPATDGQDHYFLFTKDPKGWLWTGYVSTVLKPEP